MTEEIIRRVKGHYQNLRILDWRGYVAMTLFGYLFAGGIFAISDRTTLPLLLTTSLYLAFAFSINNCFDLKEDMRSRKTKNPIAVGVIGFREAIITSMGCALSGMALSYISFGGIPSVIFLLLLLLAFAYSAPPLRFKSLPPIDTISHGLFFGALLFLYGFAVVEKPPSSILLLAVSIFLYSILIELKNHMNDYESDLAAGTITTACWLGIDRTRKLFRILLCLHFIVLFYALYVFSSCYLLPILTSVILAVAIASICGEKSRATDVASVLAYIGVLIPYIL
ncbi:MAG TPA: 4-hydroxybenzoate polyprenyltransferase [Candidatus Syntrophoarchaeum butanivorans]|uniref:4-hydroxybenzoate polyprenyltransferase n=1 Tax=Candidatus Syntropharchaeum butanivorans TaxID=1839936 RepID=A0A7C1B8C8_9EURY|nr:4-hydroxybenzoate polyprenyltransferase [Candidatus Syntrophoarchaeum butanivorans]